MTGLRRLRCIPFSRPTVEGETALDRLGRLVEVHIAPLVEKHLSFLTASCWLTAGDAALVPAVRPRRSLSRQDRGGR
jgi:hypothetical protein